MFFKIHGHPLIRCAAGGESERLRPARQSKQYLASTSNVVGPSWTVDSQTHCIRSVQRDSLYEGGTSVLRCRIQKTYGSTSGSTVRTSAVRVRVQRYFRTTLYGRVTFDYQLLASLKVASQLPTFEGSQLASQRATYTYSTCAIVHVCTCTRTFFFYLFKQRSGSTSVRRQQGTTVPSYSIDVTYCKICPTV